MDAVKDAARGGCCGPVGGQFIYGKEVRRGAVGLVTSGSGSVERRRGISRGRPPGKGSSRIFLVLSIVAQW